MTKNPLLVLAVLLCALHAASRPAAAASLADAKAAIADEDYGRAVEILAPLAEAGSPEAKRRLAGLYEYGHGLPYDYRKALKLYREAAEAGDVLALKEIAYFYSGGKGVERSTTTAAFWFKKAFEPTRLAAERGDPEAVAALAHDYEAGLGVAANPSEAARWYEKWIAHLQAVAEGGAARDQFSLALAYHYAPGVTRDRVEGNKWLERAAAQGFVPAMRSLSFNTVRGFGCREDPEGGWRLRQKLVELGDPPSIRDLAYDYYEGQPGWVKDLPKAREFYLKAVEAGDVYSAYAAGQLILKGGEGVKADEFESSRLFYKAAKAGYGDAQLALGRAYAKGLGVTKDNAEAYKWTLLASVSGSSAGDDLKEYALKFTAAERAEGRKRADAFIPTALPSPGRKRTRPASPPAAVAAAPQAEEKPAIDVDAPPAVKAKRDPDAYAVVIGVEKYRQDGIPAVDYAARDASTVYAYLTQAMGFDAKNVVLLTDEHATKTDFEKNLGKWLQNRVTEKSRVFVYYAGHGAPNPASGEGYLMPYEADPNYVEDTAYPVAKLYAALGKLPTKDVTVVLDACFSGQGGRSLIAKGARPLVIVKAAQASGNTVVLAAASSSQISAADPQRRHGLLTEYLLEALHGAADTRGDGKITADEIFAYVRPAVERAARLQNIEQTPTMAPAPEKGGRPWIQLK